MTSAAAATRAQTPSDKRDLRGRAKISTRAGVNVYEAALDRIRWLFDEFDNDVAVSNSGGKDSTVVLELAAIVNAERNLPPLRVVWIDQEAEFGGTVEYQRYLMYERDDIDFHWYQVPFVLDNATNSKDKFLNVWGPDEQDKWMRPKEPDTIHSTTIPHDRFYDLLSTINTQTAAAVLTGMRGEESPIRRMMMTSGPVYKWVTWAVNGTEPGRYRFHPLYDWTYRDIWHAIESHGWRYNTIYDQQYRWGLATHKMRVSNFHHETSVEHLLYIQEAEPETWEAATKRLEGISTFTHLGDQVPATLPYMFDSWGEYANYLIDNLITDPKGQATFRKHFDRALNNTDTRRVTPEQVAKVIAKAVILNDQWGTTIENFVVENNRKPEAQ